MSREAFQGRKGDLGVERKQASPVILAQKGDVFDKSKMMQMGDIPKIFFPEHEKATV